MRTPLFKKCTLSLLVGGLFAAPATANDLLDLIEETVGGRTYIPVEVTPADQLEKPAEEAQPEAEKKEIEVVPTPWLRPRHRSLAIADDGFGGGVTFASFGGDVEYGYDSPGLGPDRSGGGSLRRARFTGLMGLFYKGTAEASVLLDEDGKWGGVDRLSLRYYVADDIAVTAGKFRPPVGYFYATDPTHREIPTLPTLTRQVAPGNSTGIYADGYGTNWDWGAGWFSGDLSRNIPGISGSGYFVGHLGYTFYRKPEESEVSRWYFDWTYNNEGDSSEAIAGGSRHIWMTGLHFLRGGNSLVGELTVAHGGDLGSVWGLTLQDSWWLYKDHLKLVARYQYASAGDSAVDLSNMAPTGDDLGALEVGYGIADAGSESRRYSPGRDSVRANEFHSLYAGVNWHFLQQHARLHTGAEYNLYDTRAGDSESGWNFLSGLQVTF